MKPLIMLLTTAMLASIASYGQGLTFNAGDTWSYEFTPLPYVGPNTKFFTPIAGYNLTLSGYNTNQDDILIQMFEDNLSESPLFTSAQTMPPGLTDGGASAAWQDLQGWVQLSVISGSVTLESAEFDVYTPRDATSVNYYSETIPVPEPGPISLCLAGLALAVIARTKLRLPPRSQVQS